MISTQNPLKLLYNSTERDEYDSIYNEFNEEILNANEVEFAFNKFENKLIGEIQKIKDNLGSTLTNAQEKHALNNSGEEIDELLLITDDENKIKLYARYKAILKFYDTLRTEITKIKEVNADQSIKEQSLQEETIIQSNSNKTEFTIAQQTLAIYYVLLSLGINLNLIDKSNVARLIHLFSGKELPQKIFNSDIYKKVLNIFNKTDKYSKRDLEFVLSHFNKLNTTESEGLNNIVDLIEKDIKSYTN